MAPYFETVKSFADVPISEHGVDTRAFIEASDGLVTMFDLFGSGVFGFVQSDIRRNINGVRTRYHAYESDSHTLEALVESEAREDQKSGIPCLVRLMRGLALTCQALQHMQNDPSSELHVAIRSVPRRQDFYNRIAQGGPVEKLDVELSKWLQGLELIVKRISLFLEEGGYGKV